jgi:hypothetical protein
MNKISKSSVTTIKENLVGFVFFHLLKENQYSIAATDKPVRRYFVQLHAL